MTILFLILGLTIVAAACGYIMSESYSTLVSFTGVVLVFFSGITAIALAWVSWSWVASDYEAQIINREYGTNYTREEVFYASKVIETVRELDRKRVELNGDLFKGVTK